MPHVSEFLTQLGWFALIGEQGRLTGIRIGHPTRKSLQDAVGAEFSSSCQGTPMVENWNPELRKKLERFAQGSPESFEDVEIHWPGLTGFRERVILATREIRYGQTLTYGQLAARAGSPGAARAVGSTMASNRFPIVVPCHRVVRSGLGLGGFSAPQGVDLKRTMLSLEAECEHVAREMQVQFTAK